MSELLFDRLRKKTIVWGMKYQTIVENKFVTQDELPKILPFLYFCIVMLQVS